MQTPILPIQISGASATPPKSNGNANAGANEQFQQALSREIDNRKPSAPAAARPAPSTKPQTVAPDTSSAGKPAVRDGAPQPDEKTDARAEPASASAAAPEETTDSAADAAAAVTPMADMLALVASFNLPLQPVAVKADPAAPADTRAVTLDRTAKTGVDALAAAVAAPADADAVPGDAVAFTDQMAKSAAALVTDTQAASAAPAPLAAAVQAPLVARLAPKEPGTQPALKTDSVAAEGAAAALVGAPVPQSKPVASAEFTAQVKPDTKPLAVERADGAAVPAAAIKPQAEPIAVPGALRAEEHAEAAKLAPLVNAPVSAPLQQASLALAQAAVAAPAPTDKLSARVGTPGWDNQVGQKIVWMVAGGEQSASLTLNPPDLGPLQVVLSVTNDQASVTFSSAQPEVRQALENAMPKLRDMLGETGIALGNATVNAGMPNQQQAQGGEQQRQGGGAAVRTETNGSAAEAAARPRARVEREGLVDTFA